MFFFLFIIAYQNNFIWLFNASSIVLFCNPMYFIAYFCQIYLSLFTNPMNYRFFVFSNRIRNKLFVNISRRNFSHSALKQYFLHPLHDICLQWYIQRIFMSYTVFFLNPRIIKYAVIRYHYRNLI